MSDDYAIRAQLVKLEVDRLADEAMLPGTSPERITAIRMEMQVLVESLREIRREQLAEQTRLAAERDRLRAQLNRPFGPQRPSWWRRILARG